MGTETTNPNIFTEVNCITPIYVSGAAVVSIDNGNLHWALYIDVPNPDGTKDRLIVSRLVISKAAYLEACALADFEIAAAATGQKRLNALSFAMA